MLKIIETHNQPGMRWELSESVNRSLRSSIERHSFPRVTNTSEAERSRKMIIEDLHAAGWDVIEQSNPPSPVVNLIAVKDQSPTGGTDRLLFATHYDSVPGCPGADDNGSGIAVLLEIAKMAPESPGFALAFFDSEEYGLLGSRMFADQYEHFLPDLEEVHVMEMVGYTSNKQETPEGFPYLGDKGDFLGVVGSGFLASSVAATAAVKVKAIDLHRRFIGSPFLADSLRSDHVPFWSRKVHAAMWTDTSNFRNPNYHQKSDTPETLDYEFMTKVVMTIHNYARTRGAWGQNA